MSPNRAKLLVVDDTRGFRKIIRDLMYELGFVTIDEAPDGRSALELFHKGAYDLVLTDWNMPYLTGIDLLRAIRHDKVRRETPVLLFTGDVSARRQVEALEAGANGFVAKPFSAAALCEKILRIVASLPPTSDYVPTRLPQALRARL